jgi:hypothetical protein
MLGNEPVVKLVIDFSAGSGGSGNRILKKL